LQLPFLEKNKITNVTIFQIEIVVEMESKTIVEEKNIEETTKNIPRDSFTVLDFMEVFRSMFPEDWEDLAKDLDFSEAKEDTLWRRTFRISLMYTRKNHAQFWFRSPDIKKESLRITEKPQRKKEKFSEALG